MKFSINHINVLDSTNRWLKDHADEKDRAVWTDYQTAGRGCGTNTWESEFGMNLLFSMLIHPTNIPASRQFHLSMAISLAICEALEEALSPLAPHPLPLTIKWPNDIYWRDKKICGILIENTLQGTAIKDSIIGVGLNVNQREFRSDAPNPVSLWQICKHETSIQQLLTDILRCFEKYFGQKVRQQYLSKLYRRKGFHPFSDNNGSFMAEIHDVEDDGHLLLRDDSGQLRRYAFKEVQFIL